MAQLPGKETKKKKKNFSELLRIYYLPLIAIVGFFLILFLLVIPKLGEIFDSLDKINDLNVEISEKNSLFNKLQTLANNISELQSQLLSLNALAPSSQTEVVAFNSKIESLASINNVVILTSNFVEIIPEDDSSNGLKLKEISNTFKILGPKQNVLNFVNSISTINDFIIINQMDFSPQRETEFNADWILDIQIIKFQFTEVGEESLIQEQYRSIPVDAIPSRKVMEYITNK
ncbi:MAG: hypothetical protein Kow0081_2350 [Candidatus Dojkabacteria bacterium]